MKIITKIVIDMATDKVLEEESFDYDGPVDLCDFGGGSSVDTGAMTAYYNQALKYQKQKDKQARLILDRYRGLGEAAIDPYAGILGLEGYEQVDPTEALRATPGYNFMFDDGINALDRSAAAKGMLGSGAQAKGLMSYGQGLADQTYNNYMNRLYQTITGGQNAALGTAQLGQQAAQNVAGLSSNMANSMLQAQMYNAQNQSSPWNSVLGGLGLLGGALLTPVSGGFSNTLASKLWAGGAGPWG